MSPGTRALQRCGRTRSAQADLAHMRDVEQPGRAAHRMVFGQRALVLHRHRPAGKAHHARAQAAMQGVQRRGAQSGDGDRIGQGGYSGHRQVSAGRPASLTPPLSRKPERFRRHPYAKGWAPLLRRCGGHPPAFQRSMPQCGPLCLSDSGGRLRLRRQGHLVLLLFRVGIWTGQA